MEAWFFQHTHKKKTIGRGEGQNWQNDRASVQHVEPLKKKKRLPQIKNIIKRKKKIGALDHQWCTRVMEQ